MFNLQSVDIVSKQFLDENEIRKAISVIKKDSVTGVFEIRILESGRKDATVGYFTDVDTMLDKLKRQRLQGKNVYIVLNEIDRACYAKTARDEFVSRASSTQDKDIKGRWWILIDLDPIRPTDTSSSNESVERAKAKAGQVYDFLKQQGFTEPLVGFSGNGYHLLYRICVKNTDHVKDTIQRFLNTLNILFTDDYTKVDTAREILLENIKHSKEVKAYLSELIETIRDQKNVVGKEFYGAGMMDGHIMHDMDGDGVDDCLQGGPPPFH